MDGTDITTMQGEEGASGEEQGNVPDEETRICNEAGAILLKGGSGLRIAGWTIRTKKCTILKMDEVERWGQLLDTTHLPEMVFGDSSLELKHEATGIKIHFNALDGLRGWKKEGLPPVEVPAAAKWKFASKPSQQVILDYDYTFTTPYCGSENLEPCGQTSALSVRDGSAAERNAEADSHPALEWVECEEQIDLVSLQQRDPILFFDEVILFEDELADNGISLLTVKVRVMPKCWFLLLRYWLRVDGVLMRLRDTRVFSKFSSDPKEVPVVLRERCVKEDTFQSLASRGYPKDAGAYADPSVAGNRLQTKLIISEKLVLRR
ncbi:type 2A phosphatase activator TIP41 [Marchantia polymorpha subsp. ruderalis]|uniref:TIP41-like protein n=1 Tax=Marchantia polymorpha TaxID=3197 RepID=A0A2R6WRF9_MARPO|nr:hypothetical protein MARPO_0064s0080 [Marchantia polymorpha]BBN18269.1 hypothetical protein Mp_8g01180 [Marchantia polymorpha subsp. ruderalis]|eukprot:PTQ36403.1 hypothetical protein MARPO_0064s0080 [Marchantia polymorpha]